MFEYLINFCHFQLLIQLFTCTSMYVCNKRTNWNLVCRQTDDLLAPLVAGLTMEFLMLREESMSREEALRVVDDPATPLP